MKRVKAAGMTCRDFLLRATVLLLVSVSIVSAIVDPFAQVAVTADVDDTGKVSFASMPDLDPEDGSVPQTAERLPDFHVDDLRAERQESSHEWRVACAFEARGPPV